MQGFEALSDGAAIELGELGTEAVHLQANVSSSNVSSVELPGSPNRLAFSRDGRCAYKSSGHVIDAETREVVATTSKSKIWLQIDFLEGVPAKAYSRYGLGYGDN